MNKGIKFFALLLAMLVALLSAACFSSAEVGDKQVETQTDREGNVFNMPDAINRIISLGPASTEILVELGFADNIVAVDTYSVNVPGLPEDMPLIDMLYPDGELLISLEPDIVFVTGMSKEFGSDPLLMVENAGIAVAYIPSSNSIDGIIDDIRFIADVMDKDEEGGLIIADMEAEIAKIREITEKIEHKKTVYFEIDFVPFLYSFGSGTYLSEMLEIAGAVNIFDDINGWTSITDEMVLDLNPEIILTNVGYIDDHIGNITQRPGWDNITAVENEDVYLISTDATSRPSRNIVIAIKEIVAALYPDIYADAN